MHNGECIMEVVGMHSSCVRGAWGGVVAFGVEKKTPAIAGVFDMDWDRITILRWFHELRPIHKH